MMLKLVDGAGSGLDADTVRGLTPDQIVASSPDHVARLEARIGELARQLAAVSIAADQTSTFDARITELASQRAADRIRLDDIQLRLSPMSLIDAGRTLRFSGVNVQVVSGTGATDSSNGLGNLIVGYNESEDEVCIDPYDSDADDCGGAERDGSHNLIVGRGHNYTTYGGFVAGEFNTIAEPYAAVCGGAFNVVSAPHGVISGGAHNEVWGPAGSVSGGSGNGAAGDLSWIGGGARNRAEGYAATVSGGADNDSNGQFSSVGGGIGNEASGRGASVSGGLGHRAPALWDWAAGTLFEDQ